MLTESEMDKLMVVYSRKTIVHAIGMNDAQ